MRARPKAAASLVNRPASWTPSPGLSTSSIHLPTPRAADARHALLVRCDAAQGAAGETTRLLDLARILGDKDQVRVVSGSSWAVDAEKSILQVPPQELAQLPPDVARGKIFRQVGSLRYGAERPNHGDGDVALRALRSAVDIARVERWMGERFPGTLDGLRAQQQYEALQENRPASVRVLDELGALARGDELSPNLPDDIRTKLENVRPSLRQATEPPHDLLTHNVDASSVDQVTQACDQLVDETLWPLLKNLIAADQQERSSSEATEGAERSDAQQANEQRGGTQQTSSQQASDQQGGAPQAGSQQASGQQDASQQTNAQQASEQQSGAHQADSQQADEQQDASQQTNAQQANEQQSGTQQAGSHQGASQQAGEQQDDAQQAGSQQTGEQQANAQQAGSQRGASQQAAAQQDASQQVDSPQANEQQAGSQRGSSQQAGAQNSSGQQAASQPSDAQQAASRSAAHGNQQASASPAKQMTPQMIQQAFQDALKRFQPESMTSSAATNGNDGNKQDQVSAQQGDAQQADAQASSTQQAGSQQADAQQGASQQASAQQGASQQASAQQADAQQASAQQGSPAGQAAHDDSAMSAERARQAQTGESSRAGEHPSSTAGDDVNLIQNDKQTVRRDTTTEIDDLERELFGEWQEPDKSDADLLHEEVHDAETRDRALARQVARMRDQSLRGDANDYQALKTRYRRTIQRIVAQMKSVLQATEPTDGERARSGKFNVKYAMSAQMQFEATGRYDSRVFRKPFEPDQIKGAAVLAVDQSSSMAGLCAAYARAATVIFLEVLDQLDWPHSVLTFTDAVEPLKSMREKISLQNRQGILSHMRIGGGTDDIAAVKVARELLAQDQDADIRFIFVISDGEGPDPSKLRSLCLDVEKSEKAHVIGIGIGREATDVVKSYRHSVAVEDPSCLPNQLGNALVRATRRAKDARAQRA